MIEGDRTVIDASLEGDKVGVQVAVPSCENETVLPSAESDTDDDAVPAVRVDSDVTDTVMVRCFGDSVTVGITDEFVADGLLVGVTLTVSVMVRTMEAVLDMVDTLLDTVFVSLIETDHDEDHDGPSRDSDGVRVRDGSDVPTVRVNEHDAEGSIETVGPVMELLSESLLVLDGALVFESGERVGVGDSLKGVDTDAVAVGVAVVSRVLVALRPS